MLIINSDAEKTESFFKVYLLIYQFLGLAFENTPYLIGLRKMLNLLNFKLLRIIYFLNEGFLNLKLDFLKSRLIYEFNLDMKQAF